MHYTKSILKITLVLLYSFVVVNIFAQRTVRDKELYKLNMAAQSILIYYVDSVEKSDLVEDAIRGMLKDLDPHSAYLTADEVKRANEPLRGNFKGVGIEFNILDDTLYVVSVIEGGPSEKVGLLPGDRILTVDQENIAGIGLKNKDVIDRLRGEAGTVVSVDVYRRGIADLLRYDITRGTIPIYSVDAAFMASPKIGYIKVNRFGATTYSEFMAALKRLKKQGMKKLILDLQGNGGGYLAASIQLANEFIEKEKLIVYTQNRFKREDQFARSKGDFEKQELVILVDEGSASASEILTGAIQDWDRGVIIGRRTFGKGLVQRPFKMIDDSEIRLTISRYYTPSGRSIQKSYENGRSDYRKDIQHRIDHGELFYVDSISFPDSLKYQTLSTKRNVYGGGGIMPDIFVPLDTTQQTPFFRKINNKGLLNRFTLNYVDLNRDNLKRLYPTFDVFASHFYVDSALLNELIEEAKNESIPFNEEDKISEDLLKTETKAYIARYLFEREDFYHVMKSEDPAFQKAIEVLNDEEHYYRILSGSK